MLLAAFWWLSWALFLQDKGCHPIWQGRLSRSDRGDSQLTGTLHYPLAPAPSPWSQADTWSISQR